MVDRYQQALPLLDKAQSLTAPRLVSVCIGRAFCQWKLGRREDAIREMARAVHLDPSSHTALGYRAVLLLDAQETQLSLDDVLRKLEVPRSELVGQWCS